MSKLVPYGEGVKRQYSPKTTKGHPHIRRNGKQVFARTCTICREERIKRY